MRRAVALVAVGAWLAVAAPAGARPPTRPAAVCNLVADPTGDALTSPTAYVPVLPRGSSDDAMDITSADVATGGGMLTGVLRVKKLSATSSNAPMGMTWRVGFTAGRFSFTLAAHAGPTGSPAFDAAYSSLSGGATYAYDATGVLNMATNEVRITVPLSLLAPQTNIKPGTTLSGITGETASEIRVPNVKGSLGFSNRHSVDLAAGETNYVAGQMSCVKVGS